MTSLKARSPWLPMLADIPPMPTKVIYRTPIGKLLIVAIVLLCVGLIQACTEKQADAYFTVGTAQVQTKNIAGSVTTDANKIDFDFGKAFDLTPRATQAAIQPFVADAKIQTDDLRSKAVELVATSTALGGANDEIKKKDTRITELETQNKSWLHLDVGLCGLGSFCGIAIGVVMLLSGNKLGATVGGASAIMLVLSITVERFMFEFAVAGGVLIVAALTVAAYELWAKSRKATTATETATVAVNATTELTQFGEIIKDELSKLGADGNALRTKLFGSGTAKGIAHDELSAPTQAIVATARGKAIVPVRLAAGMQHTTTAVAA